MTNQEFLAACLPSYLARVAQNLLANSAHACRNGMQRLKFKILTTRTPGIVTTPTCKRNTDQARQQITDTASGSSENCRRTLVRSTVSAYTIKAIPALQSLTSTNLKTWSVAPWVRAGIRYFCLLQLGTAICLSSVGA